MTSEENRRVIAGPAGHYYALFTDWQFGETLVGLPIMADADPDYLPRHPMDEPDGLGIDAGWYEITDPAPETDDAAIIAELRGDGCHGRRP